MLDPGEYLETTLNGEFSAEQRAFIARVIADYTNEMYRPNRSDYRLAAERLLKFLWLIDDLMIRARQPDRTWREISLAFDLPSKRYFRLTEAAIGRQFGLSKMAVSKSVTKLVRKAERIAQR